MGVSFRNLGVRVPVTTTSFKLNMRLIESRRVSCAIVVCHRALAIQKESKIECFIYSYFQYWGLGKKGDEPPFNKDTYNLG